mmetsp:Transcript_22663/g.40560  ORF Transcript_22663/g.40560 Transcript_22663/m.40560 type:complete len:255 (-) Transcript_22663:632-1396(-)
MHTRRQPHRTRPLTRTIHRPRRRGLRILKHLTLGSARIPQQQHVDIPPNTVLIVHVLGHGAEERHGQCHLGVLVSVDGRCDALHDAFGNVGIGREVQYQLAIGLGQVGCAAGILLLANVIRRHVRRKHGKSAPLREKVIVRRAKHACNLHLLARSRDIDQIVQEYHLFCSWHAAGGYRPGTFLQIQLLVIAIPRSGGVELEGSFGIAFGTHGGSVLFRGVSVASLRTGRTGGCVVASIRARGEFALDAIVECHL